jgi:hypothetical protein
VLVASDRRREQRTSDMEAVKKLPPKESEQKIRNEEMQKKERRTR